MAAKDTREQTRDLVHQEIMDTLQRHGHSYPREDIEKFWSTVELVRAKSQHDADRLVELAALLDDLDRSPARRRWGGVI